MCPPWHPQIATQQKLASILSSQQSRLPGRFIVVRVDAIPAEHPFKVLGEGLLDEAVLAGDVVECHILFLA